MDTGIDRGAANEVGLSVLEQVLSDEAELLLAGWVAERAERLLLLEPGRMQHEAVREAEAYVCGRVLGRRAVRRLARR